MNFFGSTRTTSPIGQVASAEFAQIVIGQRVTLAQSCQWQFARPLRPIAAIGDPHVYFSPGIGQGSVAMSMIYSNMQPGRAAAVMLIPGALSWMLMRPQPADLAQAN
jgi:hypothetical protein